MINSPDIYLHELTNNGTDGDGNEMPFNVVTLASYMGDGMNKQLTIETHLRAEWPVVMFCVYSNREGLFASDTLDVAVEAYNKVGTEDEDTI